MDDVFLIQFPTYTFLLKDGTGCLLLQHGENLAILLFTDRDAAMTYLERSEIQECLVKEFQKSAELGNFLSNQPSRSNSSSVAFVVVDPLDPGPRGISVYTGKQFLDAISF